MTRSEDVRLELYDPQRHGPLLERWLRSPHVVRWWGCRDGYVSTVEARSPEMHAVITVDGVPVGYLCWQRPSAEELEAATLNDLPEGLVDIDILIGEPERVGRGIGPRALTQLLERLEGQGVEVVGLATSASNGSAIRAFEKAGFSLFRDFEEPDGPYRYLVTQLPRAPRTAAAGAEARPEVASALGREAPRE